MDSGVGMLSEASAASGPGLPWEHPPELLSLLGSPAPFLVLFSLYGDCSTPSCVYGEVTDHRVGPNSRRGVYTGMRFHLKYNQKQLSTSWIQHALCILDPSYLPFLPALPISPFPSCPSSLLH